MKNVNLIIVKDYKELSEKAFDFIKTEIGLGAKNLGMATGSTPIGLYELIRADYKKNKVYENLNYYNLDEYHGLNKTHPQSYYSFMKSQLFDEINASNCFIPNGELNIEESITTYQNILDQTTIDVQLLGIGNNGHIGFNEPKTPFTIKTNYVKLDNLTREANKRFFDNDIDQVPEYAITMGIADIMRAKKILLLANGESKAKAVLEMLYGEVTEDMPASILQTHSDVTVILDYKAASKLPLHTLGVDISSTRIKVAVFDSEFNRLSCEIVPHNNENIYDKTLEMINQQLSDKVLNIGVSVSGYVRKGKVSHPRIGFNNFEIKNQLEKDLNRRIKLINRANASAYGEYRMNYSEDYSLYYISLATGIGGGYVVKGNVVNGRHGFAGEICNMVVDSHEFYDDFYADGSMEMHYNTYKLTKNEKLFIKQISIVIANVVNTIDPDRIILDIKNQELDKSLVLKIEEKLNTILYSQNEEKVKLMTSTVEDESLIGAAMYASKNLGDY